MPETICPACDYRGLDRARHKADCPLRSTHGGLRTEPAGGRITGSVSRTHWALWLAFKGKDSPKVALERLIEAGAKPRRARLKKE